MAIWQFRLDIIPEQAIRNKYETLPIMLPKEAVEEYPWWSDIQPPASIESSIDNILPRTNSWSESMRIWGDEQGDTASICYANDEKNRVTWMGFRVDVRNLSRIFVSHICSLAGELGCVLVTGSYHVLKPDDAAVLIAINESLAKSYLDDPVATLRAIKQNDGGIIPLPNEEGDN
jgi:hypothetical protein